MLVRRAGARALAVTLLASTTFLPRLAAAQTAPAAEQLYRDGQKLMQSTSSDDTKRACEKFAASYRLDPALGTLMNLALCHERIGKNASAWSEYTEAASQAARNGQRDREAFAHERVNSLEKKLQKIVVEMAKSPPDFELKLDGVVLPSGVLGTEVPLDSGDHVLEVSAPHKKPWSQNVRLGPDTVIARLQVPPLEDAPDAPTASTVPPAAPVVGGEPAGAETPSHGGGSTQRTIGYAVGAAGVVGVGLAVVFGVRASQLSNRSDDGVARANTETGAQRATDLANAASDHDSAASSQTAAIIAGAAGGVALGTGIVLVLTARSDKPATGWYVAPSVSARDAAIRATYTW